MTDEHRFLALDLGAESGRGELVTLAGGKVAMEEVHRWPNRPVRMGGTLYWDFPFLFAEVLEALAACAHSGVSLDGIAVDTWGVDFGLLGADGNLLANPVHYRDGRTEGFRERASRVMKMEDIFAATALHTLPFNSLYQLQAMQEAKSPVLDAAETFLMMPDLLSYFLTGRKACERSIAQTSQLIDTNCRWCRPIISEFGFAESMFPELVGPAEVLGPLSGEVGGQVGLAGVPVIASAGHDTSAAVAAVPGEGDDWAFLSCGTWSVLGILRDEAVASPRCHQAGFTYEYTIGGWYLGRNIIGLWLVQELRRKWDKPGDKWDYERMTAEASAARTTSLVHVDNPSLLAPVDMEQALMALIAASGETVPRSRGELARCVLDSLALQYAWGLDVIGELTGTRPRALYMVGGGIRNKLLCQLTADACGIAVHAGADQCTALGNALGQALALGILTDREQIRQVMRDSFEMTTYEPADQDAWADKRARYTQLLISGESL